ncbi:hypothetical protein BJY04DRAFT_194024 [Aspergillus karnatakaensis]|uniref:uncharacterized protein n=1 Tax=Aspergillus karnatakaensis TaxID=1810916 RepID=UPI003CCDB3A7
MAARTLLDRLQQLSNVDVDDIDNDFIKSLPFKPHNQTSNQQIVCNAMLAPQNRDLFTSTVEEYGHQGWEAVFDRVAVQLVKKNLPYITGRVLLQSSPRHLNNASEIVAHCRRYASYFEEAGIPKDRYAIKLPFSGAAAVAARELSGEGIATLATAVFGLEQGVAASQAGCRFISPYFNEIAAYFDLALWPDVEDPALEHPMSARLIHILEAYTALYKKTGKDQPVMVIASHFNTSEVLAMAEMGCQHITVSRKNLETLINTPDTLPSVEKLKATHPYADLVTPERMKGLSATDPLAGESWNGKLADLETDYLADEGKNLDDAIQKDPIVKKRLNDAIRWFIEAEDTAKAAIEKEIELKKGGKV